MLTVPGGGGCVGLGAARGPAAGLGSTTAVGINGWVEWECCLAVAGAPSLFGY